MSSDKHITPGSGDLLQLVRLVRLSNLSLDLRHDVHRELDDRLTTYQHPTTTDAKNVAHLDLQLRELIQADAPWSTLARVAWQQYDLARTDLAAAKVLETAFTQGTANETIDCLQTILTANHRDFYWLLHSNVRDFILEHSDLQQSELLYKILTRAGPEATLSELELLFIFLCLSKASDKTSAWIFYKKHSERLLACAKSGSHLEHTSLQLLLKIGEVALEAGYGSEARIVFNHLPSNSKEREKTLELLFKFDFASLGKNKHHFVTQLEDTENWQQRLVLIEHFCEVVRENKNDNSNNNPALSLILANPLKWVPETVESWRLASDLIVRNRDLQDCIPDIFRVFVDNAQIFYRSTQDKALWQALVSIDAKTHAEHFVCAIAKLHFFVFSAGDDEKLIWNSRAQSLKLKSQELDTSYNLWRESLHAAIRHIEKSPQLYHRESKRLVATLNVCMHGIASPASIIGDYLDLSRHPSPEFLNDLSQASVQQGSHELLLKIELKRAALVGFENKNLTNIWYAATKVNQIDLAWRTATILSARSILNAEVLASWKISGEGRSVYMPCPLVLADFETALEGLPNHARRIIRSLIVLGSRISELVAIGSRSGGQTHPALLAANSTNEQISKLLTAAGLKPVGKSITTYYDASKVDPDIASIIGSLNDDSWTFCTKKILERLSAPCWGHSRLELGELLTNILPQIGLAQDSRIPAKLGRWLSNLTTHERAAWNELASTLAESTENDFSYSLARFSIRAATLMYPSHYDALKNLQKLRTSLALTRDLETFILSPAYSNFRRTRSLDSRVQISTRLQALSII